VTSFHAQRDGSIHGLWDDLVSSDPRRVAVAARGIESLSSELPEGHEAFVRGLSLYSAFRESFLGHKTPSGDLVEEAISCLEETPSGEKPSCAAVRNTCLGELLIFVRRHQSALTALRSVGETECPDRVFAHARLLLGRAMIETDQLGDARAVLRSLLAMNIEVDLYASALVLLLGVHDRLGQPGERGKCMAEVEALFEKSSAAIRPATLFRGHLLCGSLCTKRLGDDDRAIQHLQHAAEVREAHAGIADTLHEPYLTLGFLYLKGERYAAACSSLEKALAKARDPLAEHAVHLGLARCHEKQGDVDRSLEHLRCARESSVDDGRRAIVTLMMANLYRQEQRWSDAHRLYNEMLECSVPGDKTWSRRQNRHFYIGLCLTKLGRRDEARQHLRKALTPLSRLFGLNFGMETGACFYLGSIAEEEGDFQRAIKLYRKARNKAWTEEMLYRSPDPREHAQWLEGIYMAIARCYERLGKRRKAARYRRAAAEVPHG